MNKRQAVAYFGNGNKLSSALGVSRQLVSHWKEDIPIRWQCVIEVISNGELKADRRRLKMNNTKTAA